MSKLWTICLPLSVFLLFLSACPLEAVFLPPKSLLATKAIDAMTKSGANQVDIERLYGFQGTDTFQPAGWKIKMKNQREKRRKHKELYKIAAWPKGVGMALMNGCFKTNYDPKDVCYEFVRGIQGCEDMIPAANFLGVGFDGRGFYSSESRRNSIIQRICFEGQYFLDQTVPDVMNAFGIYDYSIRTEMFQDASQYLRFLQEKAATSEQQSMFQMESESLMKSSNAGGDFGFIGAAVGALKDKADLGKQLGQSFGLSKGSSSGNKDINKEASSQAEASARAAASKNKGSTTNMIALLEADLKLYELVLEEIKCDDLSIGFLSELINLPNSYFDDGADVKYQSFVKRWGTHYVKAAKFGGELKIMKTSKKESKMNAEQFSAAAQSEFSGMMSTLKSSFEQKSSSFKFLGFGKDEKSAKSKTQAKRTSNAQKSSSSEFSQEMNNKESSFIKTTIEVKGGDPKIAAAITEFYTPMFRELFKNWLDSIDDFVRPFEFTLDKISNLYNINMDQLFPGGKSATGCFSQERLLKVDSTSGMTYFESDETVKDQNNKTFTKKHRNYCLFGNSKEKFKDNMMMTKLALERAENIYLAEGPFSTTNFDIIGGQPGCEVENLEYANFDDNRVKIWPKVSELRKNIFAVTFDMRGNLPGIPRNAQYIVKFSNGFWFTKIHGRKFTIRNSCKSASEVDYSRVCIAELPLVYDDTNGFLYLDTEVYEQKNIKIRSWLTDPLAFVTSLNYMAEMTRNIGNVGFVPCKLKWINSHVINLNKKGSCIYFQAASKGSIFLVFSNIPDNYKTWYYLQMTPEGVAFYKAMKILKTVTSHSSATLGAENLFTGFFVCLTQITNGFRLDYGKATEDSEVGIIQASYSFKQNEKIIKMYYTFGAGVERISISDVRVVKEKPRVHCGKGLKKDGDTCVLQCHSECEGCNEANDPTSCLKCKNMIIPLPNKRSLCANKCFGTLIKSGNLCLCKDGQSKYEPPGIQCVKCTAGKVSNNGLCHGYTAGNPGFQYKFSRVKMNHKDAKKACAEDGASLAMAKTKKSLDYIRTTFSKEAFHVGIIQAPGKIWKFDDGTIVPKDLLLWDKNQPQYTSVSNCGAFVKSKKLHDIDCYAKLLFLCKAPLG